jgi:hypothetical protein
MRWFVKKRNAFSTRMETHNGVMYATGARVMKRQMIRNTIILLLVCLAGISCESLREREIRKGECFSCIGNNGSQGLCCKYQINAENLCKY